MLETLRNNGYKLAIITSRKNIFQTPEQEESLAPYFDELRSSPTKDSKTLRRLISSLGATPENTVMIGDKWNDVWMAQEAGAYPIQVSWSYMSQEQSGQHTTVDDINDIPQVVKSLIGASNTTIH